MKHSLLLLLLFVFCWCIASAQDIEIDDLYYNIIQDGTNTCVEVVARPSRAPRVYKKVIDIPPEIVYKNRTYKVVAIAKEAFRDRNDANEVIIPNTVKRIGSHAFDYFINLHKITIGSGVEHIGLCALASALDTIICLASTPPVVEKPEKQMFWKYQRDCFLQVPKDCLNKYKVAPFWNGLFLNYNPLNDEIDGKTFDVNGVRFNMIKVTGGSFTMGATSEQEDDAYDNEKPAHQVTLSDYYIGQTEVTQALWIAVMGNNPSGYKGDSNGRRNNTSIVPVESISWLDCQVFIKKLNSLTGESFRLPTEAEWEYAARGGNKSKGYKYAGSDDYREVTHFKESTHSIGALVPPMTIATKLPNELGLYDMSGNVYEWCYDWYGKYMDSSSNNPTGPNEGTTRVVRGGFWNTDEGLFELMKPGRYFRVSCRLGFKPMERLYPKAVFGLRLALSDKPASAKATSASGGSNAPKSPTSPASKRKSHSQRKR